MRLGFKGGIMLVIGGIVGHYIDSVLIYVDPKIAALNLNFLDIIFIIIGITGALVIVYDKILRKRLRRETSIDVYEHNKLPYSTEELFSKTQSEINWIGITLESLNHNIPTIKKSLKKKKVRILICKQDSNFIPEIEKLVESVNTSERIAATLGMLQKLKESNELSESERENLEIKQYDFMPTNSMIIIDQNIESSKYIQVEPYPYKTPQEKRRIFIIPKKRKEFFNMYLESWNNMWSDAKEV